MLSIPKTRIKKVIICSDAANEADDAFAIAHAILSPTLAIVGMVAGHFGIPHSNVESYAVMKKLAELTDTTGQYPIVLGAESKIEENPKQMTGVDLIISAASQEKDGLYIVAIGALSDIALAIRKAPSIIPKITVVFVGGGRYPSGSHECNMMRDYEASNFIFNSKVNMYQIPSNTYKTTLVSLAEMRLRLVSSGPLAEYLYSQLEAFLVRNIDKKTWINPECWVLGDSGAIGVLLEEQKGFYKEIVAPSITPDGKYVNNKNNRIIRVYHTLNNRMIIEDMFSKIIVFKRGNSE